MESRRFKHREFAIELANAMRLVGLTKRADRLQLCAEGKDVDGEGPQYLKSCQDVFCPFCSNARVGLVQAAIGRLEHANMLTFTWQAGCPIAEVATEIRKRWRLVKFCLDGSSGVAKWEFTIRGNGSLHLHCHAVTDADFIKVEEQFSIKQVRFCHSAPFDGNAIEVAKYLTPSGRVDVIAQVAGVIHGKRVRSFTAWGKCRKFSQIIEGVNPKMPIAEKQKLLEGRIINGEVWFILGSGENPVQNVSGPCLECSAEQEI